MFVGLTQMSKTRQSILECAFAAVGPRDLHDPRLRVADRRETGLGLDQGRCPRHHRQIALARPPNRHNSDPGCPPGASPSAGGHGPGAGGVGGKRKLSSPSVSLGEGLPQAGGGAGAAGFQGSRSQGPGRDSGGYTRQPMPTLVVSLGEMNMDHPIVPVSPHVVAAVQLRTASASDAAVNTTIPCPVCGEELVALGEADGAHLIDGGRRVRTFRVRALCNGCKNEFDTRKSFFLSP